MFPTFLMLSAQLRTVGKNSKRKLRAHLAASAGLTRISLLEPDLGTAKYAHVAAHILSISYPVPLAPPRGTSLLTNWGLLTRDSESFISISRDGDQIRAE